MKNSFLFVSFFSGLSLFSSAQVTDSMMNVYAEKYPQQKVHVQLDKNVYRAGETIWFKSYIVNGFSPALNSHNFYAELIDPAGKVLQRKIYPVAESTASGFFDIDKNFPAGLLTFRAYTSWMLNEDSSFLFYKDLTILSANGDAAIPKTTTDNLVTELNFFPEGGHLVNGVESVIAFKANDNRGMPVDISGAIVNSKGKEVIAFRSVHDGMGRFLFTPQEGDTYKAFWKDHQSADRITPLPQAQAQGVVLSTAIEKGRLVFTVKRSAGAPTNLQTLYLLVHFAQNRIYRGKITLDDTELTKSSIPVNGLPSGVLQATLFDSNWKAVAERIHLLNNGNYTFDVNLSTQGMSNKKRAKNTITVEAVDSLLTNMSIAITDAGLSQQPMADNIISRLLLTGDIKGYVHRPAYYFSDTSVSVAHHLDLVMLTHGWRRYNWQMIADKKTPILKFEPDSYLALEAKLTGKGTGKISSDEQLIGILQSGKSGKRFLTMNRAGHDQFVTKDVVFYDSAKIYFQFVKNPSLEKNVNIKIDNNFYKGHHLVDISKRPSFLPPTDFEISRAKLLAQEYHKYNTDWSKTNVMESVTVKTKAKSRVQQMDEKYASGMFYGDGMGFDMTDAAASANVDIFSFLRGRVAGLNISGDNSSISWRGSATALFLNEVSVDVDALSTVSMNDIAYVKVFRPPFYGASLGGAGGAIGIYLKEGVDVNKSLEPGLSNSVVTGYSSTKEFYSPNYSTTASTDAAADYRSTLYWQPYLLTDAGNRKVKIDFYNNDISKSFRIIIEGMNENGQLVRIEKVIE